MFYGESPFGCSCSILQGVNLCTCFLQQTFDIKYLHSYLSKQAKDEQKKRVDDAKNEEVACQHAHLLVVVAGPASKHILMSFFFLLLKDKQATV